MKHTACLTLIQILDELTASGEFLRDDPYEAGEIGLLVEEWQQHLRAQALGFVPFNPTLAQVLPTVKLKGE